MNWKLKMRLALVATGVLVMVGCGQDLGADDDGDDDCVDCDGWEFEDSAESWAGGLSPCLPQATQYSSDSIPEIPAEALAMECSLQKERETNNSIHRASDVVVSWAWKDEGMERLEHEDGQLSIQTIFEFDEAQRDIQRIERRKTHNSQQSFVEESWEFDENGRLVAYRKGFGEQLFSGEQILQTNEVEQRWEEDRLIERIEVSEHAGLRQVVRFSWEYDEAGLMIRAAKDIDDEVISHAEWTYTGNRPQLLERYIDGVAVERQSWEYDGDSVTSRRVEYGLHGLPGSESYPADYTVSADLDDFGLQAMSNMWGYGDSGKPWMNSNRHLHRHESDECYQLPTTLGHGYPDDEDSYHLGFSDDDETSSGLEFSYGYNGYYYGYGNPYWYGHLGVASAWPVVVHSAYYGAMDVSIDATIDYDAQGRMIFENHLVRSTSGFDVGTGDGSGEFMITRIREFDSPGLVSDRITVENDDESAQAELRFQRSETGAPILRERFRDGELVSFQQWEYGSGELAINLDIHSAIDEEPEGRDYYFSPHPEPWELLNRTSSEPEYTMTLERSFDDQQRQEFFAQTPAGEHNVQRHEVHTTWGEFGKLEELRQQGLELNWRTRVQWEYDEAGNLVTHQRDSEDNGEIDWIKYNSYDESGRVVEERVEHGGLWTHRTREYSCSG